MSERRTESILAAACFIAACVVGFVLAPLRGTWTDEAATIFAVGKPLMQVVSEIARHDVNPPGGYVVLWLWRQLGDSLVHLRSLSALLFGWCAVLTYWLGARFGRRVVGLLATLLFVATPLAQFLSAQARYPMLLTALVLASTLALVRLIERGDTKSIVVYAALAASAAYVHYFAVFFLVAHLVFLGVQRKQLASGKSVLYTLLLVFVLYAPWLPVLARQLIGREAAGGGEVVALPLLPALIAVYLTQGFHFWRLPSFWNETLGVAWPALPVVATLPFIGLVVLGLIDHRETGTYRRLLLVMAAVPFALFLAASLIFDMFAPHYFLPFLPFLCLLAAGGVVWLGSRQKIAAVVAATLTLIVAVGGIIELWQHPDEPENWRPIARVIDRYAGKGDAVLLPNLPARICYERYRTKPIDVYHVTMVRPGKQIVEAAMVGELLPVLQERYRRLWFVEYYASRFDPQGVIRRAAETTGGMSSVHALNADPRVSLHHWYLYQPFVAGGMSPLITFPDGPQHPQQLGEGWYASAGEAWWTADKAYAFLPAPDRDVEFVFEATVPLTLFADRPPVVTLQIGEQKIVADIDERGNVVVPPVEVPVGRWAAVSLTCDRTFVPDEHFDDRDTSRKCLFVQRLGWAER